MKIQSIVVSFSLLMSSTIVVHAKDNELDIARVRELNTRYNVRLERPKSCPLESKSFADLVAKAEAVKDVFKGNCANSETSKLDEILTSIKELKENSTDDKPSESMNSVLEAITKSDDAEVNALASQKMSSLFTNLSGVFKNNQCRMEDGKLLETVATLILETTQVGILIGNGAGLAFASGGFLLASGLKLIQQLLNQKFDFEKTSDRQSFIKLNCSFYEIRRELELTGILDLENSYTREDFRDSKILVEDLTKKIKQLETQKSEMLKANSDFDKEALEQKISGVDEVKKVLNKIMSDLKEGLKSDSELPSETQKLVMISKLAGMHERLAAAMKQYEKLGISTMPMMDTLFVNEMALFDYYNFQVFQETMKLSAKEFNENHRAKIIFHALRINEDIAKVEADIIKENSGAKIKAVAGIDAEIKRYFDLLVELKKVETRLGSLLSPKEYTGLDDGSENLVSLVASHDEISQNLYGEWGYKFLKYATEKSLDKTKEFNGRYKLFQNKYGHLNSRSDAVDTRISYVCQDAQKLRLIYRQASGLTQQGHDFVATNKDIFYSDLKNKFNMKMNEEGSSNLFMSNEAKIQRHYMSAIYASKKINGEEVSKEMVDRYLSKTFLKTFYIGHSMLEVENIKNASKDIQDSFDLFNCQKSFGEDLVLN